MYEAVLTLCLASAPDLCRDVLLPGHETHDLVACETSLSGAGAADFGTDLTHSSPKCQPMDADRRFMEVAPGVFAHRGRISDANDENLGNVSNAGFVIGNTSVVMIDAGGSRLVGEDMYRAIRSETDLPISHVILTHMHPDHVLGASVFRDAGAQIVGHTNLERALLDRSQSYLTNFGGLIGAAAFIGTTIETPDITFEDTLALDLGGRTLELKSWPRSHTSTDITVFDPMTGTLFTGDLVFDEHAPALDGSLTGWQSVLNDMTEMGAKMIVPGHGGPYLNWPEAATPLVDYLDVLARDTRKAIKDGTSLGVAAETIAQSEAPNWQLFDLFNPRNATVAFTELEWE